MSVPVEVKEPLVVVSDSDDLYTTYTATYKEFVYTINHNGQRWVARMRAGGMFKNRRVCESRYRNDVFQNLAHTHGTFVSKNPDKYK